jgi:hypothetical protein
MNEDYVIIIFNIQTFKELNLQYGDFTDNQILEHYTKWVILHSKKYLLLPNDFDVNIYRELNQDLKELNNMNAKLHYINHGIKEVRKYK